MRTFTLLSIEMFSPFQCDKTRKSPRSRQVTESVQSPELQITTDHFICNIGAALDTFALNRKHGEKMTELDLPDSLLE